MSNPVIFLSFPTVFQEVSLIHGGLIGELTDKEYRVVILVNDGKDCEKFRRFFRGRAGITVEEAKPAIPTWRYLLFGVIPGILSYKNAANLAPITRNRIEKKTRFIVKLFSPFISEPVLAWLQNRFLTSKGYDRLFVRYRPNLVILSDFGNLTLSRLLPRSARKYNVPVISVEQSIDVAEFCSWLPKLDRACVWGEEMAKELVRYHGYPEARITVIGLLRGDIYKKKTFLIGRDEFFRKEGLDPGRKLITIMTTPSDPEFFCGIAREILKYQSEGRIPYPLQIYIRPTPYQYRQKERYLGEFLNNPFVHIGEPFAMLGDEVVSEEAAGILANLVRHSNVVINILSTLTLEACLVDVPVINVAFKGFDSVFDHEYAKRIMAMDGTSFVRDMPALAEALNAYLKDPAHKREGRKRIVGGFCYSDDGAATKRAAEVIERWM